MDIYLRDELRIPAEEIGPLRERYYKEYGTTLRGLQADGIVDADDFLHFVHQLPLDRFLIADIALRDMIESLPQDRWILTNADESHAIRVLGELGLRGCFSGIIDVRALDFIPKPDRRAYERALRIAGCSDPGECVIFDDSPQNLQSARELGCFTVLVGAEAVPDTAADRSLSSLHDLPIVLPELWAPTPR
jgi:putative hydrolase of the HAD superfamily